MANGDFASGLGGFLQGFSGAAERGIALNAQVQLQQQREARLAELQKAQMGLNVVQTFRQLLDVPPNIAGPLFESAAKSMGLDTTSENFKLMSKTFGKLDPEQRQVFKNYLATVGAQNPDQVLDFVTGLTRNPETMLQLFGQVAEFQQGQQMQNLLGGGSEQGGGQVSPIQGGGITEQNVGQNEPVMQPPDPIAALEATIAQFEQRRNAIINAPGSMKAKKPVLDQADKIIDNARQRLGQLQTQKHREFQERQSILTQQREQSAQKRAQTGQQFNQANSLRGQFLTQSKDFIQVRDAFGRIQESAIDPSAAGDLALIFNFMKMLDPGSVVREGEFATAQNSAGVPDRLRNTYNNLLTGKRLGSDQRKDFVNRAKGLFARQKKSHRQLENEFKGIARRNSLSENDVVPDLVGNLNEQVSTQRAPSPQDVDKALNDAGGDPNKAAQILFNQGFDLNAEVQ